MEGLESMVGFLKESPYTLAFSMSLNQELGSMNKDKKKQNHNGIDSKSRKFRVGLLSPIPGIFLKNLHSLHSLHNLISAILADEKFETKLRGVFTRMVSLWRVCF
jgi:hypothetical protein